MKTKVVEYSKIAVSSMITKSSLLLGFFLSFLLSIGLATYLWFNDVDLVALLKNNSSIQIDNFTLIRLLCFGSTFLLFSVVSGLMQSIVVEKDSNVLTSLSSIISEMDYFVGKIVAAILLLMVTLFNFVIAIVLGTIFFDIAKYHTINIFLYVSSIFKSLNISHVFITIAMVTLFILTSLVFTILMAGRINKIQESSINALYILLPQLISLFILIVPFSKNSLSNLSAIMMFIPLFSPIFSLIHLSIEGLNIFTILSISVSLLFFVFLVVATKRAYSYFLFSEKFFTIKDILKIIKSGE